MDLIDHNFIPIVFKYFFTLYALKQVFVVVVFLLLLWGGEGEERVLAAIERSVFPSTLF